jgi:serine-type D-Ala-D-Ala carboxypeptidase/endopeptidase
VTLSAAAAAERLGRRHLGGVVGVLDLTDGDLDVAAWGSTGRADDAPVEAQSLFEIGSVTKTVTALALAVLVESGTVRLDTPLRTLLPDGTELPPDGGTEITLEHLARHMSGLPRSPTRFTHDLWVAVVESGNPYAELDEADVLAALPRQRLGRAPGTGRSHYSNLGAGLLGIALRRAAGADSFLELAEQTVLRPLGLADTVVHPSPEQSVRMAQGHGLFGRPVADWYLEGLAGAGALRSTVPDLLTYLQAQLDPDATPLAAAIRRTHVPWQLGRPHTIGLGWFRTRLPGGDLWWHNGGTGGFRSFAGFSPQHRRAVAILVNDRRSPDRAAVELMGLRQVSSAA